MSGQLEGPFECFYHLLPQVALSQGKTAFHLDFYNLSFVILSLWVLKISEEKVE